MSQGEAYENLFQRALRTGQARLSSVVMQELYAGARTPADKKDYDEINKVFLRQGHIVTPDHDDWILSGIILLLQVQTQGVGAFVNGEMLSLHHQCSSSPSPC